MKIGFVIFPQLTQLDFTGPLQILHDMPGAETLIIAETMEPVLSDCALALVPTHTFESAPELDMICVPGGFGVVGAITSGTVVDYVRAASANAKYVTSVCTGAFILGAVGLLKGKKAATHWAYTDLLPLVGAVHAEGRVVRDGNTFTGGGVTAGIDFALTVAAEIAGEQVAQGLQLGVEYDPAPPFSSGHPSVAPKAITQFLGQAVFAQNTANMRAALEDG